MAVEKNPSEEKTKDNIIKLDLEKENRSDNVNFELDPETGELEVEFGSDMSLESEEEEEGTFYENLAEQMDDEDLQDIATTVIEKYDADKSSRSEWESMFERGFDLLGLKLEDTTEPFEGAATAVHPLLIESAVKFQSKASGELFPSKGPVKVQILGNITESRQKQANRVQNFMNYQVSEQMPEFFDETERMLFHLPLLGSAIKKIYYDDSLDRPVSEFVPIDQFYVSYYATDLRRADRYTHILYRSPIELARQINAGMYADIDLPDPELPNNLQWQKKWTQY